MCCFTEAGSGTSGHDIGCFASKNFLSDEELSDDSDSRLMIALPDSNDAKATDRNSASACAIQTTLSKSSHETELNKEDNDASKCDSETANAENWQCDDRSRVESTGYSSEPLYARNTSPSVIDIEKTSRFRVRRLKTQLQHQLHRYGPSL